LQHGFSELIEGEEICLVSTGYMTHTALKAAEKLIRDGVTAGVIDVFVIKPMQEDLFFQALSRYKHIVTIEEAFINKGGLDSLVLGILNERGADIRLSNKGFKDSYVFDIGSREYLHRLNGIDVEGIIEDVKRLRKVS